MDLKNKLIQARELINKHYSIHCEQINHHSSDNNLDLTYFINFYLIEIMSQIQSIFNISDKQFEKLQKHPVFEDKIIKYIDAIVIKLANMALDQRLYAPRKIQPRKP